MANIDTCPSYRIHEVFGREIAGNHTVHAKAEDGTLVCSCFVEIVGDDDNAETVYTGRVWFESDAELENYSVVTEREARATIARIKNK